MPFTVVMPPSGLVPCSVEVGGDALVADNALPFFLRGESRITVHLVSGHGGASRRGGDLYFPIHSLDPDGAGRLRPTVTLPEELSELVASRGVVVLLSDVACSEELAADVERLVRGGAGVLVSAGSLVDRRECNERMGHLLPAELGSVKSREADAFEHGPVGLAAPDVGHPLWAPFAQGGLDTFASARFDRVQEVEPHLAESSEVLARYTDGRAALLQRAVGDGRLILFTSTLDADWNDLPIRAIYLPMMHQLVRYLARDIERRGGETYQVGERPELEPVSGAVLRTPRGAEVPLAADDRSLMPRLELPGHYQLLDENGRVHRRFAVRIDPAESALERVDPAVLAAVVPGAAYVREGEGSDPDTATVLRPVSLVPHLAALLLVLLVGEAVLGRRR